MTHDGDGGSLVAIALLACPLSDRLQRLDKVTLGRGVEVEESPVATGGSAVGQRGDRGLSYRFGVVLREQIAAPPVQRPNITLATHEVFDEPTAGDHERAATGAGAVNQKYGVGGRRLTKPP